MKIGNPIDKTAGVGAVAPTRTQAGEAKVQDTAAQNDPSAKVELSSTASTLLSSDTTSADFDADKVARIAQAIADGKFEINAEKIADRLIANAHEVLGKTQH